MDAFHGTLVDGFEVSLTVLSTVMARHGDTVILDAGRKSIGIDFVLAPILGYPYQARYYAEEHALFDVDGGLTARPGDQLRLVCGYAPTTVNLHDVMFAIRDGVVAEIWPVFPRGPGHHGFLTCMAKDR
jgi:D-serine deaminase-like pyridoxal phosphate-dependent protein